MNILFPEPIAIEPLNVPLVAFISPVIIAPVADNIPAGVTLKGAELKVACPK